MSRMSMKQIDVRQAHELQSNDGYTYVDVRSVPEYDKGHPVGAHNVPLLHYDVASGGMVPNPDFLRIMQASYSTDAKLLVGCQMGGRSSQAVQILASAGYTDLSNVMGGFGPISRLRPTLRLKVVTLNCSKKLKRSHWSPSLASHPRIATRA